MSRNFYRNAVTDAFACPSLRRQAGGGDVNAVLAVSFCKKYVRRSVSRIAKRGSKPYAGGERKLSLPSILAMSLVSGECFST